MNKERIGLHETDPKQFRADTISFLVSYGVGPALMDVLEPLQEGGIEIANPDHVQTSQQRAKMSPRQHFLSKAAESVGIPNLLLPERLWHDNGQKPLATLIFDPFEYGRTLNRFYAVKTICALNQALEDKDTLKTCQRIRNALPEDIFVKPFKGMSFGHLSSASFAEDYSPYSQYVTGIFIRDGVDCSRELEGLPISEIEERNRNLVRTETILTPDFFH
jgi:hypothetical protein